MASYNGIIGNRIASPQFRKLLSPVIENDRPWEGPICSITSGLLRDGDRWRLWYSNGHIGADQQGARQVLYAESDDGLTWRKPALAGSRIAGANIVLPPEAPTYRAMLPSMLREQAGLTAFIWCDKGGVEGLFRFVSQDGQRFELAPDRPLIAPCWGNAESKRLAGEGRASNDAYSLLQNEDGSYTYYAADLLPNTDPRAIFAGDNMPTHRRIICRADSADGIEWTPTRVIIEPNYDRDAFETQFYGLHAFRYKNWYVGLLHVYLLEAQTILPELVCSRDGTNWRRSYQPCIELGAPGSFDSRMILFGDTEIAGDELVWLYCGANWRHNDYASPQARTCIGRATMPLRELDEWLEALDGAQDDQDLSGWAG